MREIPIEENQRVVTALTAFSAEDSIEKRAIELSIEFLTRNDDRSLKIEELSEYVEEHIFRPPESAERGFFIGLAVGVGIGYAAGSLVEYMMDQV